MLAGGLGVVALAVGAAVLFNGSGDGDSAAARTRETNTSTSGSTSTQTHAPLQTPVSDVAPAAAAGVPVRVAVPRLGIDSPLDHLGLTRSGVLQTPPTFTRAGWFADGVHPGDVGPAVIAGHVDSRKGPAVFFALTRARAGDEVDVRDASGATRRFTVTAIKRYAKSSFGTAEVYGPTALPQLRLITCTGVFDTAERSYRDNLVVFATLRQPRAG